MIRFRPTTGLLSLLVLFLFCMPSAHGQAVYTASRRADLQAGVTFSVANPDTTNDLYNLAQPDASQNKWHGYGAYVDLDLRYHFGVEANFHQLSGADPTEYERTFQIGPRFVFPVGRRFVVYGKAMEGRGIFNFAALDSSGKSYQIANLAYNTQSAGGGLDLRLRPGINVRLFDYEYQVWDNFPPNKLRPQLVSFGVAYHFHGPLR